MFDWDDKPELNITPLVYVMLVLLAILMVISPNIIYEELIRLPKGTAQQEITKKEPIEISLLENNQVKVNGKTYTTDNFSSDFNLFSNQFERDTVVRLSADERVNYGQVMRILSIVKQSGFTNISLPTS